MGGNKIPHLSLSCIYLQKTELAEASICLHYINMPDVICMFCHLNIQGHQRATTVGNYVNAIPSNHVCHFEHSRSSI